MALGEAASMPCTSHRITAFPQFVPLVPDSANDFSCPLRSFSGSKLTAEVAIVDTLKNSPINAKSAIEERCVAIQYCTDVASALKALHHQRRNPEL